MCVCVCVSDLMSFSPEDQDAMVAGMKEVCDRVGERVCVCDRVCVCVSNLMSFSPEDQDAMVAGMKEVCDRVCACVGVGVCVCVTVWVCGWV